MTFLNIPLFIISLAIGFFFVYIYNPDKKIIYFDYTLQHIHHDDIIWKARVNRLIKNQRNKYHDLLLSIEIL